MIRLEDRQTLVSDIDTAREAGARLALACDIAGIDERTFQRWKAGEGLLRGDGRPLAARPTPAHALTESERAAILALANEPRYAELPPAGIVPALADEGTLYRKRINLLPCFA
jgi:putative transposase